MAEQELIPIVGSPEPQGKGLWCIYQKVGIPIGVGRITGEFFDQDTCWVQYSELPIAEAEPFPISDVSMFGSPQEAIRAFSKASNMDAGKIERVFRKDFPSWSGFLRAA